MPQDYREDGQVDLFLPQLTALPLRDQRETMERPFFSLSKRKRLKPIDYISPDRKITVHVSANSEYGLATIYDLDILIYCASVLIEHKRRGANDIPQTLNVVPYDMLRTLKREVGGRAYDLLGNALDRLQSTTVKTNIRSGDAVERSEEHTSELQSLMRISYAVFCLKKKKTKTTQQKPTNKSSQYTQ